MAIDDTQVQFSSQWEIDQRKDYGTKTVSAGTTLIATANTSYPLYEMQFKPSGSTEWFMAGVNSSNNTVSGVFTFFPYVNDTNIYAACSISGDVRYYIYTDKVNY